MDELVIALESKLDTVDQEFFTEAAAKLVDVSLAIAGGGCGDTLAM